MQEDGLGLHQPCVNNQEFHRQKISKDINDPNGSITQLDLTNIYGIVNPRASDTIILSSYVICTKTDPCQDHNT